MSIEIFNNEREGLWHTDNDFAIMREESSTDIGHRKLTRPRQTVRDGVRTASIPIPAKEIDGEITRIALK